MSEQRNRDALLGRCRRDRMTRDILESRRYYIPKRGHTRRRRETNIVSNSHIYWGTFNAGRISRCSVSHIHDVLAVTI